jgi:hypothetical protein
MKKETKIYKAKGLIEGERIKQSEEYKYVAVPDKGLKDAIIRVEYMGECMIIKDWRHQAIMFRRFSDLYRQGEFYTLGYFIWNPTEKASEPVKYKFEGSRAIPI